jgi:hypothetical protein
MGANEMKITPHISYTEAIKSQTATRIGIDNTPTDEHLKNMEMVATKCFEPVRVNHGKPIGVSSFYRSPRLNTAIGGSKTSDHSRGCAIDIDADIYNNGITNKEIFEFIKDNLKFDQLIWEYGDVKNPAWVHVSYRSERENRNQILIASRIGYQLWEE